MDLSNYLNRFSLSPSKQSDIASKRFELAKEISAWSNQSIPIGRVLHIIKYSGVNSVREIFEETKKSEGVNNPVSLFLWKISENRKEIKLDTLS